MGRLGQTSEVMVDSIITAKRPDRMGAEAGLIMSSRCALPFLTTAALPSACSPWVALIKEDKADRPMRPRPEILAENQRSLGAEHATVCYVVYRVVTVGKIG